MILVWRAPLDVATGSLARFATHLSEDEVTRASRFRFGRDRDRFVAARGLLRQVLAVYLNVTPASVQFGYSSRGKPFLLPYCDLEFNLSHAGSVLVIAVARGRRVGIDVEAMATEEVVSQVAGTVLSPPERAKLDQVATAERRPWFARMWTHKEAYIKADGRGMSLPLEHIDVMTEPGAVMLFDPLAPGWSRAPGWTLRSVPVDAEHAACVAAEGSAWRIRCSDWAGRAD